ncbi:P-type conjugative transfer protein TrbG [Caulobacter sp. KR2-114]|uniref:P-type conjugative transfer protein TrbG n=1 Tax=Caulobacter sp. KR2-114 TaxID=3400912 RepID=UPI003C01C49E
MIPLFLGAAAAALAPSAAPVGTPLPPEPASAPAILAAKPAAGPYKPRLLSPAAVAVARANAGAHLSPAGGASLMARMVYPYAEGALFDVYAAPDRVTDIVLQPGETLVGTGPVAAGDTVRWIIGDTESGSGASRRIHILVKPTRPDLATNLVINTDRRTYHLDLHATGRVAMSEVSWRYADDALVAIRRPPAAVAEPATKPAVAEAAIDLGLLNFGYRLEGDKPLWRPLRVFDDGRQVVIDFPEAAGAVDLPPLFVLDGKTAVLVNYRMVGRRMVVDHLFQVAELRLAGAKGRAQVVRIARLAGGR